MCLLYEGISLFVSRSYSINSAHFSGFSKKCLLRRLRGRRLWQTVHCSPSRQRHDRFIRDGCFWVGQRESALMTSRLPPSLKTENCIPTPTSVSLTHPTHNMRCINEDSHAAGDADLPWHGSPRLSGRTSAQRGGSIRSPWSKPHIEVRSDVGRFAVNLPNVVLNTDDMADKTFCKMVLKEIPPLRL